MCQFNEGIILCSISFDQFGAAAKISYFMLQQGFKQVTDTVYNQEYENALQEMNRLISDDPQNSNLYSNRALLLSQLERDQDSVKDLAIALQLNPRNYIAYFNMFSILYRLGQDNQAFQQLCCSLSCLHLMRARLTKSVEQADKAIKHSHNNFEAHLLKGLIYSSQGKHVQAYSAFDEATSIDPSNEALFSLKAISYAKAFPGEKQPKDYYDAQQYKTIEKKLKCSYRVQQNLQEYHFQQKLNEFNALYSEINNKIGAVTQKVNKTQTIINEASYNKSRTKDCMVLIEDQGQPTPKPSEVRPQPGNLYICSLKISKLSQSQSNIAKKAANIDNQEEDEFKSILNSSPDQNDYFSSILQSKLSEEAKQVNMKDDNQKQEPLVLFTPEISQNHKLHEHSSTQANNCDKVQAQEVEKNFDSILSHPEQNQPTETVENIINQHYNLIYPLDLNYQLKVSVIQLQFTEMVVEYSDLYSIITYSRKLTTLTKPTVNNICVWNQQFKQLTIPSQPTDMKIKIYNKKYQSIRDEYIGEVEVLITTADLLKLPIYNKKGQILGEILVQLQLVSIEQEEQNKQEESEVV